MTTSDSTVIVGGARTPFGKFLGSLSGLAAQDLGAMAIKGALAAAGISGQQVDHVVMGQVLTAGSGQLPVRVAATTAGIPMSVPALAINRMCLSGIDAITLAHQMIFSGDADIVVAGGQESMSNAPHLLQGSRRGTKYGNTRLLDHLSFDGLQDAFTGQSMGALTDSRNARYGVGRAEQDEFAAQSHIRANRAFTAGLFASEIVPVSVLGTGSTVVEVSRDEGVRPDTTGEGLSALLPVFDPNGTITAGNASPISDGACAAVVMRKSVAERLGLPWLAEILSRAVVAGPDSGLHEQPSNAVKKACGLIGLDPAALDLLEVNEAFAAIGIVSTRSLGVDADRVNVNGGALAVGHPIGVSGARIALHLALELGRRGGGIGAAALCGGGGQGQALVLRAGR
ncbi:acetyl-CoA C-acetyltransferase [Rhodococcus sp. 27YEA15]|uniref:acetyl-CoA C-acyltransferase n=1 Tax=Rhodococcus sp. 27YEA15 TaxID=3156259 RepID=UPI003C7CC125